MRKGMIITIALALLLPLALQAQPGQGGPRDGSFCNDGPRMGGGGKCGHRGGPGMRDGGPGLQRLLAAADEIGLTEEQVDKLKSWQTEFQMEQIDVKAELQKAQVELKALMRNDDASEVEVNRAIDRLSSLRGDIQKLRYSHRQQIKTTLTDEQTEKLQTLRKERREKRQDDCDGKGPHGQRGGRRGGGRI